MSHKEFVPAAHWHFLTPCYDSFVKIFFGKKYKEIAKTVHPKSGEKILDLGCGPGNLLLEMKKLAPKAAITGLDIDPNILTVAYRKLDRAGFLKGSQPVQLIEASATSVPFSDNYFDIVVSTLMIHHLTTQQRKEMLKEAHRVLKPGGKFFLLDFGPPKNLFGRGVAKVLRYFEDIDDAVAGNYPRFILDAGFKNISSLKHRLLLEMFSAEK